MGRPRLEPTIVRNVRMTEAQWAAFDALGGTKWLRSRISKLASTGIAKRQRNARVRAAQAAGATAAEICEQFGIHRSTLHRIVS